MLHVDEGHKLLDWTLDLLSAACPLIKTGDKLDFQNWVIFVHKSKQDAVPSTSPTEYYGTYITYQNDPLNFLVMPDRRQTRNDQILLHVFAAATSRKEFLSFWWRVLCKYSVRSISFHILLHPFISFHIILVKNPCISYHVISFLAALLDLIWRNDPYADKRYWSIFVRLAALEFHHLHLRSVWWMILDILPARKILKEGGFPTYIYVNILHLYIQ